MLKRYEAKMTLGLVLWGAVMLFGVLPMFKDNVDFMLATFAVAAAMAHLVGAAIYFLLVALLLSAGPILLALLLWSHRKTQSEPSSASSPTTPR